MYNLAALLYLVSGVLFILALRGLSHPTTSRQGNRFGMIGMGIAILTTLVLRPPSSFTSFILLVLGLGIGGGFGALLARRVQMTKMPQLVAFFHSLVGLAAVLVAAAALFAPQAFGIGVPGDVHPASLIEMSLGAAIGAVTFTGSIIAFLKLDGRMKGKPILLPQRHTINLALGVGLLLFMIGFFARQPPAVPGHRPDRAGLGRAADHPDRRRRHARGRVHAQLLFGLGGGRHRLHARQHGPDHHGRAGRFVGRDPVLHHVQGHEPQLRLGHPRRLRRGGRARQTARRKRARSSRARRTTPPTSCRTRKR